MARTLTTTERGLGREHQKRRVVLLRLLVEGTPCWWCGQPMFRSQQLSADHSIPRASGGRHADRLLHRLCNNERQDGRFDHLRPALKLVNATPLTSREW